MCCARSTTCLSVLSLEGKKAMFENLFDVAGKVVLVPGGAQGLGRMIAEGFVRAGCRVYISSRHADAASAAAKELGEFGSCEYFTADLSSPQGVKQLATAFSGREPRLHVLVNNAGRTWSAPLES